MKKIFLSIFGLVSIFSMVQAQTSLQAGDIAFVALQSGQSGQAAKDRFAFITLKGLDVGTQIVFTDNGVLNASPVKFCTNEGFSTWTATSALPAGTVVSITEDTIVSSGSASTGLAFSQSGDQVLAFQINGSDTLMLAGISTTGWENACATSCGGANNNKSCLPFNLENGVNAVGFPDEKNNVYFNLDDLQGTPAEILAQINNPVNWTRADELQTWPSLSVVITSKSTLLKANDFVLLPGISKGSFIARNGSSSPIALEIFHISGRKEWAMEFPGGNTEVNVSRFAAGMYLARAMDRSGNVKVFRFLVED